MKETSSLKRKTVSGLLWSFTDLIAGQGIQFIVLLIMARLLSPEYFGIIGMVTFFIVLSNSIIDSGFTQALIRENNASQEDYSTVFFFNLIMSIVMYMLIYCLSPLISNFYGEDELTIILRVLSLGLIINSLGIIQRVILIKNINFRTQTKINLIASICAGTVAVYFALQGFGVWSLVAQTLTLQFTQTILLWFMSKWIPRFIISIESFKRLFGFGYKLLISGLIDTIYNNVYSIIIGRMYSATQLGFYTNAAKLGDLITISTTSALQRVTYPVLSSIQDNEIRLRDSFQRIIRTTAYTIFPIMMGLIAISDSLIPLLLGPKWFDSIIYFKLLCIAGMLYPLHAINLNILQVKGRSDLFLKLEVIKKTLLTILIGSSIFFSLGIIGLIWSAILSSYLSLFINTYYSAREISYSTIQQLKEILPSFLISAFMGSIVYLLGNILLVNELIKLIIQISSGCLIYVTISWIFRLKEFEIIYQILLGIFRRLKYTNKSTSIKKDI